MKLLPRLVAGFFCNSITQDELGFISAHGVKHLVGVRLPETVKPLLCLVIECGPGVHAIRLRCLDRSGSLVSESALMEFENDEVVPTPFLDIPTKLPLSSAGRHFVEVYLDKAFIGGVPLFVYDRASYDRQKQPAAKLRLVWSEGERLRDPPSVSQRGPS